MSKLAVIASRDAPPGCAPLSSRYQCVLIGDGSEFEKQYIQACEFLDVPVVVFRPYFKVDKGAEFSPGHFFAANRQKIWNADDVLIIRTHEDETVQAEEYANKLGKRVTLVRLEAGGAE